jgi:hypothetical protein
MVLLRCREGARAPVAGANVIAKAGGDPSKSGGFALEVAVPSAGPARLGKRDDTEI